MPIIFLLMPDKKNDPYLRQHNVQALVTGIAIYILATILSVIPFLVCITWPLGVVVMLYYAYQAYQGKTIVVPVITDFVKNQGWA